MIREAVILCGGLGTRLQLEVPGLPKAMAPLKGRPFLEYQLEYLIQEGVNHVILATGHLSERIEQHFGDDYHSIRISYSREVAPLGTGGAARLAARQVRQFPFVLLNGDTYFPVPLEELYLRHRDCDADLSMALIHQPDASRYGGVAVDELGHVLAFSEKGQQGPALVNAGTYLVEAILEELFFGKVDPISLERDGLPLLMSRRTLYGFPGEVPFIDIGVPEDYRRAVDFIPASHHADPPR